MRAWRAIRLLPAIVASCTPLRAEIVHTPVLGDIELTTAEVDCPSLPSACFLCVNDVDTTGDARLIVAAGGSSPGIVVTAYVEGVVRPFVELDGITVPPELLPAGSFFRSGVAWGRNPFPPSCSGNPPGVTYTIGDMPTVTGAGNGESAVIDIAAPDAEEVPFTFTACSYYIYWGAGCEISGSQQQHWELHLPAATSAFEVAAGDGPPIDVPAAAITLDPVSGAGGRLTVMHAMGTPPVGPPILGADGYWDVRTEMAPGSFVMDLTLLADLSTLPAEVAPEDLRVLVYDETADAWEMLPTELDIDTGAVTASTTQLSVIALGVPSAVPARTTTWGAVKARY